MESRRGEGGRDYPYTVSWKAMDVLFLSVFELERWFLPTAKSLPVFFIYLWAVCYILSLVKFHRNQSVQSNLKLVTLVLPASKLKLQLTKNGPPKFK